MSAPRLAHGTWIIARAYAAFGGGELKNLRDKLIDYHLNAFRESELGFWLEVDDVSSISELSFLLMALYHLPGDDDRRELCSKLASTLWSSIDAHGRITTHSKPVDGLEAYQDYFPGQALLALATSYQSGVTAIAEVKLDKAFKYYRHRYRFRRNFGQVSWLMQAFGKWWSAIGNSQSASFVFEIGDWILQYQQEKTGAFINDHQSDTPGYTTQRYIWEASP